MEILKGIGALALFLIFWVALINFGALRVIWFIFCVIGCLILWWIGLGLIFFT